MLFRSIYNPNRQEIEEKEEEEILFTTKRTSTLAFEDIWPSGGDYDMNDVVVEYTQSITFNQYNKIKNIVDHFKAVNCGANILDGFGIMFNDEVGTLEAVDYYDQEDINQFSLFGDIRTDVGKQSTITRTFEEGVKMFAYNYSIDPFIVPNYVRGERNRAEVHLPKNEATPWINTNLIGQGRDAYYLDVEGKYPFAIELVEVVDWEVVTEKSKIGSENEYPQFIPWVESKGKTNQDWYLYKN